MGLGFVMLGVLKESATFHKTPTFDGASMGHRIDINTASNEQLESLPGIGPAMAKLIINSRPFDDTEELQRVRGIGAESMKRLRPLLRASQGRRAVDKY